MFTTALVFSAAATLVGSTITPATSVPGISLLKSLPPSLRALNRPAYGASPLSLNTSNYQFELDGSIPIDSDFDAVSVDISYYGV